MTRIVTGLGFNGKDRVPTMIKNEELWLNHQMKIYSNMEGKEEYHSGKNKDRNYH
ncbi:hypothetical protein PPACK8108_LOCUS10903 [Phakopsora pachyrhizi]|uniref:Uncharacterized protein n=1 Tax=Phakopsora pachyrhizi TaxID=170000 RepID=A0AAV0AZ47_PHAPC|nr:hypothetical protein PPACK8108_LOCUS10903 [Phakopsora pachyrhizi]